MFLLPVTNQVAFNLMTLRCIVHVLMHTHILSFSQDEWDSEDEGETAQSPAHVTYYVKGVANSVEIGRDHVQRPILYRLRTVIQ